MADDLPKPYQGMIGPPLKPLDLIVECYGKGSGRPVLYLGDSSVERIAQEDSDRRTTDQMLDARFGGGIVCGATHSAYHPTVYLELAKLIGVLARKPQLVILPVNLRCFSPTWEYRPEFGFASENARISRYRLDGVLEEAQAGPVSRVHWLTFLERWLEVPESGLERVVDYLRLVETVPSNRNDQEKRRGQLFSAHYLHTLEYGNARLGDLQSTLDCLEREGINVLVYMTPLNISAGCRHLGEMFARKVKANTHVVLKAVANACLDTSRDTRRLILDWTDCLGEDCFFHPNETTEHINQHGRSVLADKLERVFVEHSLLKV